MPKNEETKIVQKEAAYLSPKIKIGTAALAIIISVLYLSLTSFGAATTRYLSVEEAVNKSEIEDISNLGIIGKLVPNTFRRSTDGLTAFFSITDEDSSKILPVSYSGEIGEIFFNDNAEIILIGSIESNGLFVSSELTIKCPSKYVDQYEQDTEA